MTPPPATAPLSWTADMLPGFEQAPIGRAVLVRRAGGHPTSPRAAVLHVHGYNDYFFQEHLAEEFEKAGYAFYAVDAPRAGRALEPGDTPHFMTNVKQPAQALDDAMAAIDTLHPDLPVVVHAHSTGGLIATLWAARRAPANLALLVLNSPFYGLHLTKQRRLLARVLMPVLGRIAPRTVVSAKPSVYAHHLHRDSGGLWTFDTHLKRPAGVPARAGWLRAVIAAQARARRGLTLPVPTLVARSDSTGPESADNPRVREQDVVLEVADIAATTRKLGPDVEEAVIANGVHELSLSAPDVRRRYLGLVLDWIDRRLP